METIPRNLKLTLAYDGSAYLGWQKTDAGPSIESTLQSVLEKIFQEPIYLQAASRTDAGVHADGQIVNFKTMKQTPSAYRLLASINRLLPKDIVVLAVDEAAESFHPTIDCIGKEYHYLISYGAVQLPKQRAFAWHFPADLDVSVMRSAADLLIGEHDFSGFCNYKRSHCYNHYNRIIHEIGVDELPEGLLRIRIQGNNFLYKMVRNIVGTLTYIGCGTLAIEAIPKMLETKERIYGGITAPAHGLTLKRVFY